MRNEKSLNPVIISFLIFCTIVTTIFPSILSAQTIAILDFENSSGHSEYNYLSKGIPDILLTDMMVSEKLTFIERGRIKEIIKEQKLSLSGLIDEKTSAELGKLTGAELLLTGSFIIDKDILRIDGRIISVKTGKVIYAEKTTGKLSESIIRIVDDLAGALLKALTSEDIDFNLEDLGYTFVEGEESITVYTEPENRYLSTDGKKENYFLIDIIGGKIKEVKERSPLNITVVIDKSGSMESQNKLEYVKDAAIFVVNNLTENDFLS
ncbi:MAG: hypothetical protein KAS39_04615, partial [Actinomycetia bacterium]|nr:hypothetical protein [Actinomycetes bacterium]